MFLVFGGLQYYPSGGWRDFLGGAETREGALIVLANRKAQDGCICWWQIVDTTTMSIVLEG